MKSSLRSSLKLTFVAALGGAVIASAAGACSGDTENQGTASQGTGAAAGSGSAQGGSGGGSSSGDPGTGGIFNPTGGSDAGLDPDSACAAQSAEATLIKKPVDVIFVIDNSGSMTDDIIAVENNINDNFAAIIAASGVDYRVIMVAEHGSAAGAQSICVKAPLSTTTCSPIPADPGQNPPIFYQYSVTISSHNSLCQVLNTYDGTTPDQDGFAPGGWKDWLRKDALKVFVEITDDGISCSSGGVTYNDGDNVNTGVTVADKFDTALLAKDPVQFGDANARNYIWHSIIGVKENDPATAPYLPADPIIGTKCVLNGTTSPGPGTGYQALSIKTGGLRFPICQNASFDVVFQEIAKGVIEGAQVACEFPLPEPPDGKMLDLETVVVEYTAGGMGAPVNFKQVKTPAECAADSFYIEGEIIKLCTDSCAVVQTDDKAKLAILFGCDTNVQ
jgi:hypothetical protein